MSSKRFASDAGIAIGPILFILALLGILATVMSVGGDSFGTAGVMDRIAADVASQANLIRAKITECNTIYGTNNNGDGFPASADVVDGTLVSDLECEGDPTGKKNIWDGLRNTLLPRSTNGFSEWVYVNDGEAHGRCFWTEPAVTGSAIVGGLNAAASKFSSREITFDPNGTSLRFVVFITRPSGTVNANCVSN